MHAEVGDEIVVEGGHVGDVRREGMVLEVLGEPGHEHYLVRWDDNGHETIFYPGPDARIVHLGKKKK